MRPIMLKAKSSENSRPQSAKFWRFGGPDGQGLEKVSIFTAIKYKNLSVYKTVQVRLSHISKTAKIFFSEKLIERTDEKAISSFLQLFWKKKIFAVLDMWLSRS